MIVPLTRKVHGEAHVWYGRHKHQNLWIMDFLMVEATKLEAKLVCSDDEDENIIALNKVEKVPVGPSEMFQGMNMAAKW